MRKLIFIKTCILAVFCYIGIVFNIFIYCIQCIKPSLMVAGCEAGKVFNINLINFARFSSVAEHFKGYAFGGIELKSFLSKFLFEYVNFNLHRVYNSSFGGGAGSLQMPMGTALNDPNLSLYFTIIIIIILSLIVLIIKFKLKIKLYNITKLLSVASVILIEENNILPESTKIENKDNITNISPDDSDSENSISDSESLNSIGPEAENTGWDNIHIPFGNLTDMDKETYIQNKMELKGLNTNSFLINYFIQAILNNTSGSKIDVDNFLNQNLNTILNDQRNIQLNQHSFVRIKPLLLNNSCSRSATAESLNLQNLDKPLQTKSFQSVVPFKPMNDFDLDD